MISGWRGFFFGPRKRSSALFFSMLMAGCGAEGARPSSADSAKSIPPGPAFASASVSAPVPASAPAPASASAPVPAPASASAPAPAPLPPPGPVVDVVAKDVRGCAIFQNGMLQCWGGFNHDGQLGAGDTKEVDTPRWVVGIRDVKKLVLGSDVTCAIVGSGALSCWGRNLFIKNDSLKNFPSPTKVPGLEKAVDVAIGDHHVCAVNAAGDVYCWGDNDYGQLGLGDKLVGSEVNEPTKIAGVSDAIGVAVGHRDSYAWTKSGELYRWGSSYQPIKPWAAPSPRKVMGLSSVTRAWVEGENACALLADRQVRCFIPESLDLLAAGKQLDLGPQMRALAQALTRRKNLPMPKLILPDARELRDVLDVLVFNHDASALTAGGEVYSWGNAERGTVGRPERTKGLWPPTRIAGLTDVSQIAGGFLHRCALKKDGSVHCFGGRSPARAPGSKRVGLEKPAPMPGLPKVKRIAAGDHCTFAIGEDDSLWAFGDSWINACGAKETDSFKFEAPQKVPLDARPPG